MKKQTLSFFFLLLSLTGCKTLSVLNRDEATVTAGMIKVSNPNLLLFEATIQDKSVNLLFDTGSERMLLGDNSILADIPDDRKVAFGKIRTPDHRQTNNTLYLASVRTPFFYSDSKVIAYIEMIKGPCFADIFSYGVFGIDEFVRNGVGLELNFDKLEITSHLKGSFDRAKLSGFTKIKSEFKGNQLFVIVKNNQKEERLLFDTGNTGGILLPYSKARADSAPDKTIVEGTLFSSFVGTFGQENVILNEQVVVMGTDSVATPITMVKDYPNANIGMNVISLFNWFIDFDKKEVYLKRNSLPIKPPKILPNTVLIRQGKLWIASAVKGKAEFELGSEVVSVSGEEVTADNLCEQYLKLNTSTDWKSLNVVIRPPKP